MDSAPCRASGHLRSITHNRLYHLMQRCGYALTRVDSEFPFSVALEVVDGRCLAIGWLIVVWDDLQRVDVVLFLTRPGRQAFAGSTLALRYDQPTPTRSRQ